MLGHATDSLSGVQAMADIFALGCIQSDVMFRNDDYIAAEKVGYLANPLHGTTVFEADGLDVHALGSEVADTPCSCFLGPCHGHTC